MAITNAQQYKQLVNPPMEGKKRPGYRGDDAARSSEGTSAGRADPGGAGRGDTRGDPGRADDRGTREQNRNQRNITRDAREREKIKKEIAEGPTLGKRIRRNPLVQTASFFSNPLGFIGRKIMDERRAKRVNELFGVDDDLGYTGADMGFVVSQPPKPEFPTGGGDDGPQQIIPPTEMIADTPYQEDIIEDESLSAIQQALLERGKARAFAKEGGRMGYQEGGIMDLEQARQGYKLGKLVKKVTRGLKKIVKSPIGAAALTSLIPFGEAKAGTTGFGKFFSRTGLGRLFQSDFMQDTALPFLKSDGGKLALGAGLTLAPLLFQEDNTDEEYQQFLAQRNVGGQLPASIPDIRKNYRDYMARGFLAEGGKAEPVAEKTMPLIDMDGKEKDYRETGGFVDMGRMERADDVPARLSKNEFVFTADAVRNAGEGNIDKGAEVMYNMMKNLEAGGEVSEESQGLDGARKMFQTSQRLEEIL